MMSSSRDSWTISELQIIFPKLRWARPKILRWLQNFNQMPQIEMEHILIPRRPWDFWTNVPVK